MLTECKVLRETAARCFDALARYEQALYADMRDHDDGNFENFLENLQNWFRALDSKIEEGLCSAISLESTALLDTMALQKLQTEISTAEGSVDTTTELYAIAELVGIAQTLDDWFELVFRPGPSMSLLHDAIRCELDFNGCIELPNGGRLLRQRQDNFASDHEDRGSPVSFVSRYLRHLAYLPANLNCDNPDMLREPGVQISTQYRIWRSAALAALPIPKDPVIGIAPLALRGCDVSFIPSACKNLYGMRLNYGKQRFAEALREALVLGVHILLIPEMALPEDDFVQFDTEIAEIILSEQADFFERTGELPALGFIVAGVLGGLRPDGFHRNYAVMFDSQGQRAKEFEQLKLSHWNLNSFEQKLFGIDRYHADEWPLADPVIENCRSADTFTVIDIPGVGRTGVMICADMSQDNPGDWLSLNAMLDMLFAPIMDKSICWEISDSQKQRRSWIIRRSLRTAMLAQSKVIATNSVALSRWVNETNQLSGSKFPQFENVGIGLAINGKKSPPTHSHVVVDVRNPQPVCIFDQATDNWEPFPPNPT